MNKLKTFHAFFCLKTDFIATYTFLENFKFFTLDRNRPIIK